MSEVRTKFRGLRRLLIEAQRALRGLQSSDPGATYNKVSDILSAVHSAFPDERWVSSNIAGETVLFAKFKAAVGSAESACAQRRHDDIVEGLRKAVMYVEQLAAVGSEVGV